MTVAELIKELKEAPGDAPVRVGDVEFVGTADVADITDVLWSLDKNGRIVGVVLE